ncbi:MAG: hypothetical protein ACD_80C00080G0002 [uncultured bacterium (gcode 4)]|uniref:Uncharacterized protein n=1 Tax=uncultured bacterium (gcode 4) TaxID=1234023 RepID=K1YIX9_9BACT|nr:MAG: hypothetical protein ACD_80C00080G0002 [uncultured bacterium (gcode 4)]
MPIFLLMDAKPNILNYKNRSREQGTGSKDLKPSTWNLKPVTNHQQFSILTV